MILETLNLYVRVLTDISHRNQEVDLFGQRYSTPLVLGPIELADLVWFGAKGRITQLWRQLTKTYPFAPHQCQHAASKRSPKKRRQDSGFNSMSCETEALLESLFVALKKRTAACWSSPLTPNYSGHENGIYATALWFPPKFTLSTLFDFLIHIRWLFDVGLGRKIKYRNFDNTSVNANSVMSITEFIKEQWDVSINWDDIA